MKLKPKGHIQVICLTFGRKFEKEFQFLTNRKFRFDWAFPEHWLAIEYEGLISNKSRHTTIKGFSKDCEKYNLAQLEGWTVLRYTALNYLDIKKDLETYFSI